MQDFSKNFFELFGMPVGFGVDVAELADRYRALQRIVHPDRFAHAGDRERRVSMQRATHINEAFETLKNPLARARYLLRLKGIDLDADTETTTDMEFLMEQMSLREALAEAGRQPDPLQTVAHLGDEVNAKISACTAKLAVQLEEPAEGSLDRARELVRKLQFLQKLKAEAEALEAELEDAL